MATTQEIGGIGHSVMRKEDARFIRGKGTTSTTSRCRCSTWRSSAARSRTPDSKASTPRGHRSSTVSSTRAARAALARLDADALLHTQAVLVTDKVRYQGQEVACVIAESAIAKDALELIDVDYEPLPAVTSPQDAKADGAPKIRDEGRAGGQPRLPLGGGRQGRDRPRLRRG